MLVQSVAAHPAHHKAAFSDRHGARPEALDVDRGRMQRTLQSIGTPLGIADEDMVYRTTLGLKCVAAALLGLRRQHGRNLDDAGHLHCLKPPAGHHPLAHHNQLAHTGGVTSPTGVDVPDAKAPGEKRVRPAHLVPAGHIFVHHADRSCKIQRMPFGAAGGVHELRDDMDALAGLVVVSCEHRGLLVWGRTKHTVRVRRTPIPRLAGDAA